MIIMYKYILINGKYAINSEYNIPNEELAIKVHKMYNLHSIKKKHVFKIILS